MKETQQKLVLVDAMLGLDTLPHSLTLIERLHVGTKE